MPRLTVVDVGDGSCAVLRCSCVGADCPCGLAVVDCGNYLDRPAEAAKRLTAVLGVDGPRAVETLVVTHFDADHWHGLRLLAPAFAASAPLTVVYPRLPAAAPDVPAVALALQATRQGKHIRAIELLAALRKVRRVLPRPLARGDSFDAAARPWTVMWPPDQLDAATLAGLHAAVLAVEELADALEQAGEPALRRNLDAAFGSAFPRSGERERGDALQDRGLESSDGADELRAPDAWDEETEDRFSDLDLSSIPAEFQGRFREVMERVARAGNDLSLVFSDGHVAFFGDVQGRALEGALTSARRRYAAVVAPHHGTHPVPQRFPASGVCIAQAGRRHRPNWHRHVDSHGQPRSCINTADVGTISVW